MIILPIYKLACVLYILIVSREVGSGLKQKKEVEALYGYPIRGFYFAAARKAKGISKAQLADAMGVDQPMISRWESGKVSPNKENLAKLKEILQD